MHIYRRYLNALLLYIEFLCVLLIMIPSIIITSRVRPPNGGRNEANSDIDTGYTNVVAVALAKTAANYFVI